MIKGVVKSNEITFPQNRSVLPEKLATVMIWSGAAVIVAALGWILADVLRNGLSQLTITFFTTAPTDAGRAGGIGPIIVSSLLILAVTLFVSVPLSLATAIQLATYTRQPSFFSRSVRRSLDVLASVPSIVFGLFGNAFFCIALGLGYSILSGGLTLAFMVVPILVRTTEAALRAVPDEHRHGAAALGLSRTTILLRIELPATAPAMAVGLVLGIGRAIAETAALIFTAGYVTRMPESLSDSGRALSVHIYDLAMNVPSGNSRAYATAAVLIIVLLVLNASAGLMSRLVGGRNSGDTLRGLER